MQMQIKEYQDKVRGCWLGKNIGGTLGAPFECVRGVFEIDGYTQDMSKGALPNDDLDLQLIWLNAAEQFGRNVDSMILGEYWLSYIVADWSEYGAGKNNLAKGLLPPFSGQYNNHNKDSCGAFIRSEIWACLAPGHPEIAVNYALQDAIVDHAHEGVYAEIFCAAVQSAAFSNGALDELVEIGLSYIPQGCDVAKAVKLAQDCYRNRLDWRQARKKILQSIPGSFGMYAGYQDRTPEQDVPVGALGYDAPSNIGLMMLGWLYGEGDFGKSICIAAGCGEDGDCTAATLGALLGIISGGESIPEKWTKPIGDTIKTISLDCSNGAIKIPETVTELTNRVCRLMPVFMGEHVDTMNPNGMIINLNTSSSLYDCKRKTGIFTTEDFKDKMEWLANGITQSNPLVSITIKALEGINLGQKESLNFEVRIENRLRKQQWLNFRILLPEAWTTSLGAEFAVNLDQFHGGSSITCFGFSIFPAQIRKSSYDLVIEVSVVGRPSRMYIPVMLLNTIMEENICTR